MENPFNPSFGINPRVKIQRMDQVKQLVNDIKALDTPYRTTMIYGNRGVGKTVFMSMVSQQIAQDSAWIVVNLTMGEQMLSRLVEKLYLQVTDKLRQLFNQIQGIEVKAGGFGIKLSTNQVASYEYTLEIMLKQLQAVGKRVLVVVDEVQSLPGMIELASVYQVMLTQGLPIAMLMTGLPKNVQLLQTNRVLTFLLRSGMVELTTLEYFDVQAEYRKAFVTRDPQISATTIRQMAQLVAGYAYAFQLLGYLVWRSSDEHITLQTIERILPDYQSQLSRNSYVKVLSELSTVDQKFVVAMAEAPIYPVSTTYLGTQLQQSSGYIGMYRKRLIDAQVVKPLGHGQLSFMLPLFREFVLDDGRYLVGME